MRLVALVVSLVLAFPAEAAVCDGISPASNAQLTSVRVVSGLSRPVLAVSPPGDVDRLLLVDQDGTIRIRKNGQVLAQPFLDISAIVRSPADFGNNEEGLLGLAFHPDYATNGGFFVYHTNTSSNNEVARYTVSADPDVADAGSRQQVIPSGSRARASSASRSTTASPPRTRTRPPPTTSRSRASRTAPCATSCSGGRWPTWPASTSSPSPHCRMNISGSGGRTSRT